ncbi:MAG: hypothetical protein QM709_07605 [Spongiibacteraceae bacterium]
MIVGTIASIFLLFLSGYGLFIRSTSKRKSFIENYRFNPAIGKKVQAKYPHLTENDLQLVFHGLREYFCICSQSKRKMVSMPSQVVDVAWHEFILFTQSYQRFCKKALGRFLHHTPTEAMRTKTLAQEGIKRAWRLSCANGAINPSRPDRLPLLFAIDALLKIEDGFNYSLNCKDRSSPLYGDSYCASHIGCTSGCGGGSTDSGSGFDSSGDPGGCSGDSGGGCGGGD